MVPVYEWFDGDVEIGLGTELEFNHWRAEGVLGETARLGDVLGQEPASEDEKRMALWAA